MRRWSKRLPRLPLAAVVAGLLSAVVLMGGLPVWTQSSAPGGVSGAALWIKGDLGLQVDGSNQVEQWLDQSGSGNTATELRAATPAHTDAIAASAAIVRVASGINFNPAVDFTGATGRSLKGNAATDWDATPLSIFAVAVPESAPGGGFGAVFDGLANWTTGGLGTAGIGVDVTASTYLLDGNGCGSAATTSSISEPRVIRGTYASVANLSGGSIWLNGVQEGATGTACPTAATTLFEVGGRTAGAATFDTRIFSGKIAEVVVYKSNPTVADADKIESYLAVKYGITLRQAPTPKNYFDSGAAVIWDATANVTYRNNIAGIGRDDESALNQRQSRSVNAANSGNLVTMALGTIAADNASNPNSFAADRSFLIWGDDGASAAISTSVPGTIPAMRRMARVWRVQETGTVASVRIGIPVARLPGERPVLIRSADATFDTGDTFVPLTLNGSDYEATTDFPDGEFFTFAAVAGDPGGVSGAALWVKADIGLAVNGSNQVEQWLDQSGSANTVTELRASHPTHSDAIVPSADILRVLNSINFNPAVDFSRASGRSLKGNAFTEWDTGPLSIFAVSVAEGASVGNISAVWDSLANWTTDPNAAGAGVLVTQTGASYALDSNGSVIATTTSPISQPRVIRALYATAANTLGGSTWLDGVQEATGTNAPTSVATLFELGGRTAGAAGFDSRIFNGKIAEVAVYKSALTAANANKVESYLALKYGITLRQTPSAKNYVDAGDTVIWDATANAAYNNNIAGIGRDDASILNQKQSRSVNSANSGNLVTVGLGTIAADNASNLNTFAADRDFLTWGDDGLATTFSTLLASPAGIGSRMLRTWRTQETGMIGTVTVGVPPTLSGGAPLYLVTSNDATFDIADTWLPTIPFSPDGLATYLVANANFAPGQYFTFAIVPLLDLGDAPASYGTLIASNGARHGVPGYDAGAHSAPLMLGALIDVEADGRPSAAADADDTTGEDDEDGVLFPALVAGQMANLDVTVTNSGPAARLSAWADWNSNGTFEAGEQIVTNLAVVTGSNITPIVVPASVNAAINFRFRLSTQTGLGPTGVAADGEVEDYLVLVASQSDLAIVKTGSQSSYVPGAPISYTIVVTNAGPSNAAGVTVSDVVPAVIRGVTASCSATGPASCGTNASSGNDVSLTGASLPAGAGSQLTITITGTVEPSTTGALVNTATVSTASDPNSANNSATDTRSQGAGVADLRITKTDGQAAYVAGSPIAYTVTVTNAGPSHATALNVSDLVPANIEGVTVNCVATGGTCGVNATSGNNVSLTSARLNAGAGNALTLTITGVIRSSATGVLSNTAQVSVPGGSGYSDPDTGNNSATDTDTPGTPQVDLSMTTTDGRATYLRRAPITYTITIMNAGPSDAVAVSVSGLVPPAITGVTATCTAIGAASCGVNATAGNSVSFTGASVAAGTGHRLMITLTGVVSPGARGPLASTAIVTAGAGATDTTPENNSATDTDGLAGQHCDVNGDGFDEIVTGAGPGGGPHVQVWTLATGVVTNLASFYAYEPLFGGGVFVACGDVDGDGLSDVVTGAGPGGGPHVRAFSFSTGSPVEIASFYAYDPNFRGGVRVAAADVNGDGLADIITGAGPGGGPHVRAFSLVGAIPVEIASFYAYGPAFAGGVFVAGGDVTGDGQASIITGTYREGGPVRVFDLAPAGITERAAFFPYFSAFRGPVHVGAGDLDGDGVSEIITGAGPGGGPHVRAFNFVDGALAEVASFYAYNSLSCDIGVLFPEAELCDGVFVGSADLNGDGVSEIVTGTNRQGGPVRVFHVGTGVSELASFYPYFEAFRGPVHVAVSRPDRGLLKLGIEHGVRTVLAAQNPRRRPLDSAPRSVFEGRLDALIEHLDRRHGRKKKRVKA